MDETLREQVALFRYGVISELVARTLAPGEKEKLLTEIAGKEWTIPGSGRTHVGRSTARDWVGLGSPRSPSAAPSTGEGTHVSPSFTLGPPLHVRGRDP